MQREKEMGAAGRHPNAHAGVDNLAGWLIPV
jgi:hypothetical protein